MKICPRRGLRYQVVQTFVMALRQGRRRPHGTTVRRRKTADQRRRSSRFLECYAWHGPRHDSDDQQSTLKSPAASRCPLGGSSRNFSLLICVRHDRQSNRSDWRHTLSSIDYASSGCRSLRCTRVSLILRRVLYRYLSIQIPERAGRYQSDDQYCNNYANTPGQDGCYCRNYLPDGLSFGIVNTCTKLRKRASTLSMPRTPDDRPVQPAVPQYLVSTYSRLPGTCNLLPLLASPSHLALLRNPKSTSSSSSNSATPSPSSSSTASSTFPYAHLLAERHPRYQSLQFTPLSRSAAEAKAYTP
ncbi:uncharacterized protein ARMOST_02816 [Armillaria ostoyae]|uniref:Uncharacterized protein n=1 Tax=Armillaria ostoyae TaxID=47428 RepID=A0A284QSY9_ARMOS|nr:uncharacterized protein ARMOST_02816 [Armillaria ostoyae]